MTTIIKPEELIEEVRKYPVLYDQTKQQYRNSDYKDLIWKKVSKELTNVEGQEEECKKKWNGIRDSLRRARQKRKTKSGQRGGYTPYRYKYEAILEFLVPHLADRKGLSNVPDEENDDDAPENGHESQQDESQERESEEQNSIQETQQPPDVGNVDEPEETIEPSPLPQTTTPTNRVSAEKKPSSGGRKRKLLNTEVKSQQSASSQLMAYILAEKKAESTNMSNARRQNSEEHPVDAFLAGLAPSLKSLDPVRLHAAKGKIFNVVQEYELQQLRANSQQKTTMSYMCPSISSAQTSSTSTPAYIIPSEEDEPYADSYRSSHFPNDGAAVTKGSTIIEQDNNISFFNL